MPYSSSTEKAPRLSSLALVIGLHGAAIAVALLAQSTIFVPDTGEITKVVNVAPMEDPPPLPPPPEPQTEIPPPPIGSTAIVPPSLEAVRPAIQPITPRVVAPPTPPLPPAASPPPPVPPMLIDARFTAASLSRLQPAYPGSLLRAGIEGEVTVRVTIGPDGRVKRVDKVRADHDAFFEATRRHALRAWQFEPATRDGRPIESSQTHTVRFTITG